MALMDRISDEGRKYPIGPYLTILEDFIAPRLIRSSSSGDSINTAAKDGVLTRLFSWWNIFTSIKIKACEGMKGLFQR